jgi:hypothetical protein
MKRQFLVTIDVPSSYTVREVAKQIKEDIGSWAGAQPPYDRMYDLAAAKISVKPIPKKKEIKI